MKRCLITSGLLLICMLLGCSRHSAANDIANPEAHADAAPAKIWNLYSEILDQHLDGQKAAQALREAMRKHPPTALIRLSPVQKPERHSGGTIQGTQSAEGAISMGAPLVQVLRYIANLGPQFPYNRIVVPNDLAFTRYDYVDTMPRDGREVLQQALKNQFGIVTRKDMRQNLVMTVKIPNAGLHKHSDPDGGAAKFKIQNVTMGDLAKSLGKRFGVKVTDQTGLIGGYDYSIDLPRPSTTDDMKKAVQDQLGLQLAPANDGQEIEFVVAEKAE